MPICGMLAAKVPLAVEETEAGVVRSLGDSIADSLAKPPPFVAASPGVFDVSSVGRRESSCRDVRLVAEAAGRSVVDALGEGMGSIIADEFLRNGFLRPGRFSGDLPMSPSFSLSFRLDMTVPSLRSPPNLLFFSVLGVSADCSEISLLPSSAWARPGRSVGTIAPLIDVSRSERDVVPRRLLVSGLAGSVGDPGGGTSEEVRATNADTSSGVSTFSKAFSEASALTLLLS